MATEILSLTSLRFIAAFYVFLFHCQIHFGSISDNIFINKVIGYGQVSMTLFFILSGYILSHVYKKLEISESKTYFISRFSRIYPTYVVFGLLSFPLLLNQISSMNTLYLPDVPQQTLWATILISISFLLMIQAWFPMLISLWNFGGSWSLSVEALFYLIFPIIRQVLTPLSAKTLMIIIGINWLWASLPAMYFNFFTQNEHFVILNTYTYVSPAFRLGEFIFGVAFYILLHERNSVISRFLQRNHATLLCLIMCYTFLLFLMVQSPILLGFSWLSFLVLPTFTLTIYFLHHHSFFLLENKVFLYLGRVSYSFYLAQFFVFGMYKEEINTMIHVTELRWLATFAITVVIASTLYHTIENPARRYLKKHL